MKNWCGFSWRRFGMGCAAASLAACAVGPDFAPPKPPQAAGYAPRPSPSTTSAPPDGVAGGAQGFDAARQVPAEWWAEFRSPALDALVRQALRANPSIEAGQAALRQAQEFVYAQQGFFYPAVQAGYSVSRIKVSGNTSGDAPGVQGNGSVIAPAANTPSPVIYNWHSTQLTVGFVPDVFGANARQVESLRAQADWQRYQLEATLITVASNVVAAAIQEASVRDQIAVVNRLVEADEHSLKILQHQFKVGYAMRLDVATQETALAQARQLLPPLTKSLEQTRDLLRVLAGQLPSEDVAETFELASLRLPAALPLSLPSQLVAQRPDIQAAEAQLHSASALVGVAVAARLPQFSITGTAGGNAAVFGEMFASSGRFFTIVGNAAQTLFDGGTLLHRQRAAEEALAQAEAQYRSTVLTAFQNVADTLHAIQTDADALDAADAAAQAAQAALDLTRKQQQSGYVNVLTLLTAQQAYEQTVLNLVQARAQRLGDTAALYQALGGGWWNRAGTP